MDVSRLKCRYLCSNCYIVTEKDHAFIVDPCEPEVLTEALPKNVTIDFALLTHEHSDHIFGVTYLREELGVPIICSEICAENIQDARLNFSFYYESTKKLMEHLMPDDSATMEPFVCHADKTFKDDSEWEWMGHTIRARLTPGHSVGGASYIVDGSILFAGDTIFRDEPTNTRAKGGSRRAFKEVSMPIFRGLPMDTTVYPGHFDPFLLKDWSELEKE